MERVQFSKVKVLSVSSTGIEYLDEYEVLRHIDFQECRTNWLKSRNVPLEKMELQAAKWHQQCVGMRNAIDKPRYIEFFTEPHTHLEFDDPRTGHQDYRNFYLRLLGVGCVTFDLS